MNSLNSLNTCDSMINDLSDLIFFIYYQILISYYYLEILNERSFRGIFVIEIDFQLMSL
jgi:hypothetical protein